MSVSTYGLICALVAFATAAGALGLLIADAIWQRIKPMDSSEFAAHVKVNKWEER